MPLALILGAALAVGSYWLPGLQFAAFVVCTLLIAVAWNSKEAKAERYQIDAAKAQDARMVAERDIEGERRSVRAWRGVAEDEVAARMSAAETIRTLATEHAKSVRPETALNLARKWLKRRNYMAADVAAIYAARVAKGGK